MTLVAKTSAYSLAAGPGEVWGSPMPLWKTLPGPFIQVSEVTSRHNPSGQVDKQPRDRTLTPLQWKRRVSTTGPPGKSQGQTFLGTGPGGTQQSLILSLENKHSRIHLLRGWGHSSAMRLGVVRWDIGKSEMPQANPQGHISRTTGCGKV